MRDPRRIEGMLDAIRAAWKRSPDQRLTQLILNACRTLTVMYPDTFYVEDDVLEAKLREGE